MIRGACWGVETVSRMKATDYPSGEIAGLPRSAPGSSAMADRCAVATSMRTSTRAVAAPGAGSCHVVTTKVPSAADVEVRFAQRTSRVRGQVPRRPVSRARTGAARRARGHGPSTAPGSRCAAPPTTLLSLRASAAAGRRRCLPPRAVAATHHGGRRPRTRTADTAGQRDASKPRRRRRVAATAPPAVCRHPHWAGAARNSRSPSAVNTGDDSPLAPWVIRRAGRRPPDRVPTAR